MREEIEKLLYDFVELYNGLREDENSPKVKDALMDFGRDYFVLLDRGIDFYPVLEQELADDFQLYVLVMSALNADFFTKTIH